jgi:hydroxymethylpyrimidine/phosphomethylpyrimidine kinase
MSSNPIPVALTIAGSDPSAGAGLQADLKSFAANGVYGLSAVTCTTSQVPGQVTGVVAVPPEHLREQVRLLLSSYPIAAIKTGMLYSVPLMQAVVSALDEAKSAAPLIVDPVMVATSGDSLLVPEAVDYYRTTLLPRASLFTPNLDEAAVLLGGATITRVDLEPAAIELAVRYRAPVLLKGGHLRDGEATDILCAPDGRTLSYSAPFVEGFSTHGTGCTYSAAIAAQLARGVGLADAVTNAKTYITAAIAGSHRWPTGMDALNHFPAM